MAVHEKLEYIIVCEWYLPRAKNWNFLVKGFELIDVPQVSNAKLLVMSKNLNTVEANSKQVLDKRIAHQWRIQDFPEEGANPLGDASTYYLASFSRKLRENERIWTDRRGARP